jgi:peptidoglycan L-alanyl-D-glutamate endopeptidase CwlK
MPKFGLKSEGNLTQVHPHLVQVFRRVIEFFDHSILGGVRSVEQQRKNVAAGLSQTMNSMHLPQSDGLSHAIDAAPYPQHWDDELNTKSRRVYTPWEAQLFYFAGVVVGYGHAMGVKIRYGGDFNRNNNVMDSKFEDLDHFEYEGEV